jgi:hypothetical protein
MLGVMHVQQRTALAEISTKTLKQIQIETAYTWAYRAWAAYSIACERQDNALFADAIEYEHEAIEHAALADDEETLTNVRLIIADGKRTI